MNTGNTDCLTIATVVFFIFFIVYDFYYKIECPIQYTYNIQPVFENVKLYVILLDHLWSINVTDGKKTRYVFFRLQQICLILD